MLYEAASYLKKAGIIAGYTAGKTVLEKQTCS